MSIRELGLRETLTVIERPQSKALGPGTMGFSGEKLRGGAWDVSSATQAWCWVFVDFYLSQSRAAANARDTDF